MKNKLALYLFCILALCACQKENHLESQRITESNKDEHWTTKMSYSVFSSEDEKVQEKCTAFNDEIKGLVHCIQATFLQHADEQVHIMDSAGVEIHAPFDMIIDDSVYMATSQYISLLVHHYEFLGGANGNLNFYAMNFDIEADAFLEKGDILDIGKSDQINLLLKKHLQDPDGCFTFAEPTIDNCTVVNFSDKNIEFTYAKYILGPGACGPVTISVPREELKDCLKLK